MGSAIFAFLHHLAAFALVSGLAVEFVLVRDEIDLKTARRLLKADLVVGVSAAAILVVGLLRVVYFEKGLDYYSTNLAFIGKMAFFVAVALLSIYPSRVFISWRKALTRGHPPLVEADKMRSIRKLLHWELVGVVAIILCAALMARGFG